MPSQENVLQFTGCNFFMQRLLLSLVSRKPIRITDIRQLDDEPGLREFEVNLVRLFDKITNGTVVKLNETGTSMYFMPGLLHGGRIEHTCCNQRAIGYYLYPLMCLGPFCKVPLDVTFDGVTSNSIDPSIDIIKMAGFPVLKKFLVVDDGLDLKIINRGVLPLGGGKVHFKCPVRKQLRPVQWTQSGMVKRVRGTAYALRISPAFANRMIDTAKGVLLNFIPDVYVTTDQNRGKQSGKSPGFGVNLVAETNEGVIYSTETVSKPPGENEIPAIPEDLGRECATKLLTEIYRGGCVDSHFQSMVALLMVLSSKDVSKVVVGPLTDYTMWFLRHIRDFLGVSFKVDRVEDVDLDVAGEQKILLTCVGIGYSNMNKRVL